MEEGSISDLRKGSEVVLGMRSFPTSRLGIDSFEGRGIFQDTRLLSRFSLPSRMTLLDMARR